MTATSDSSAAEPVLPRRQVLADDVYDVLKDWLQSGHIEPGSRVKIDTLAARLAISNTPIRQALGRLEADGLVHKQPYRGFVAASLPDRKTIADMYECRLLLEPPTAARAAAAVRSEDLAFLRAHVGADAPPHDSGELDALVRADELLHGRLATMAGNTVVADTLERLFVRSRSFRSFYTREGAVHITRLEHEAVVLAISRGDGPGAAAAMTAHLEAAAERMLGSLA
ncbi:transcriptional regulator, GntR family [Streptomyces sp. TLI_053]|uniref:GntR family transcriptional regulator n=1 Tax=Streptomyces sp. TLI_053 TaxID=1855352 RepID=UPI0008799FD8|nr:GntR family transcriptional regulator [Streptomyces sp. TLI_053]SDT08791.1 transcriptional regulator, GntR family [Streptomyces sp. TLI_053]